MSGMLPIFLSFMKKRYSLLALGQGSCNASCFGFWNGNFPFCEKIQAVYHL